MIETRPAPLDDLWLDLWEDLRRNATGRPTGLAIVAVHRPAIEAAAVDALRAQNAELAAQVAALREERDLAIAHDRQPYPTAWAYEQACRVRDEALAGAAELRERLGWQDDWERLAQPFSEERIATALRNLNIGCEDHHDERDTNDHRQHRVSSHLEDAAALLIALAQPFDRAAYEPTPRRGLLPERQESVPTGADPQDEP